MFPRNITNIKLVGSNNFTLGTWIFGVCTGVGGGDWTFGTLAGAGDVLQEAVHPCALHGIPPEHTPPVQLQIAAREIEERVRDNKNKISDAIVRRFILKYPKKSAVEVY